MDTPERPADLPETTVPPVDESAELTFDEPVAVVPVVAYEPATGAAFSYAPPPPPKPLGPPKSVLGAALLNLTGLGLG
jgi:hypothetical protein